MSHEIKCGVAGLYMLEAVNKDTGERRTLAPWFPNLITDSGLNRLGTGGVLSNCSVGSGSATPTVSDVTLQSVVATTTSLLVGDTPGAQASAPYYGYVRKTFRFGEGVAAGNLSEVGIGWAGGLFSRSLIKDGLGNPTTVTVLSNEYLDVTYEIRCYPPTTDISFQVVSAEGATHDCVVRANIVNQGSFWPGANPLIGGEIGFTLAVTAHPNAQISNGTLGSLTSGPTGVTDSYLISNPTSLPYVDNSLEREGVYPVPLASGNFAGGISVFTTRWALGAFQYSFNPPIMKDNTKTLELRAKISWARKVI